MEYTSPTHRHSSRTCASVTNFWLAKFHLCNDYQTYVRDSLHKFTMKNYTHIYTKKYVRPVTNRLFREKNIFISFCKIVTVKLDYLVDIDIENFNLYVIAHFEVV